MKIQEIKNTLGPHQRETLILRVGDIGGTVHFTVPDLTGITSADFRLIKPDGTFVVKSGAIVQNTVIVQITEQMCTVYGSGIYNLELKASGVSVYTAIGHCLIDKNIDLNDYAASVAEVNGLVFPDDFLTEYDLSDYVTETELSTALSNLPTVINYSTTEQNTGLKWIDGKPIYQKTFNITPNSYADISELNIDTVMPSSEGVMELPNRIFYHINIYGDANYKAYYETDVGAGRINTTVGSGWAPTNICITLRYTKTTDTV